MKPINAMLILVAVSTFMALLTGCGTVEESSDTWESTPPVSVNARLEYRVDSLTNENRRLTQQVEALATENRNLTARSAELETRLNDMASAPKPEPAVPTSSNVGAGYEGALAAYNQKDFSGAIQAFESLLVGKIGDDLADNCHYWMGESYYGMKRYSDAIEHFKMVLGFRTSEKKDDAQLMIGNASLAMGDKEAAREAYSKVISTYPASSLVSKAREKLARLN